MTEFCDLPDEMVLEIFSHLDGDTLKMASLVSIGWNELIGSSSQVMDKFVMSLMNIAYRRWTSSENQILQLKRKYQHLRAVLNGYDDVASVSRVLKRHGSYLRSFEANAATFDTPESAGRVFSLMPLIQTLTITNCKILTINTARFHPISLQRLKTLELVGSHWRILELFETCPVESLTVEGGYKGHAASLVDFLSNARHLKNICLSSAPFKATFRAENSRNFQFHLNRLKVAYAKVADAELNENFNKFLSTQKGLRDLDLMCPASNNVLRTVFNNLQNLTTLNLLVSNLPTLWEFYKNLLPLKKLRKLEIHGQFPSEVAAKSTLKLCPNIEEFSAEIDPTVSSLLPFMAANNQKIQKLSMSAIRQSLNSNVAFKHLRHFEVDRIVDQGHWLSFVKQQTSIETLKIRKYSWHTLSEEFTCKLDHMTNVKSILFVDFHDNL